MSLIVDLSLLIGAYVVICSIIMLIEQAYDRRIKKREITMRHFQWLWNRGLLETANIIDPRFPSWRNF